MQEPTRSLLNVSMLVGALRRALKLLASVAPHSWLGSNMAKTFIASRDGQCFVGANSGNVSMMTLIAGASVRSEGLHCFPWDKLGMLAKVVDDKDHVELVDGDGIVPNVSVPVLRVESFQRNGIVFKGNMVSASSEGITLPEPTGLHNWSVDAECLVKALDGAKVATRSDDHRFDGVLVKADGDGVRVMASDRSQFSHTVLHAFDEGPHGEAFIPSESVKALRVVAVAAGLSNVRFRFEATTSTRKVGPDTLTDRHTTLSVRTQDVILEIRCDPSHAFPTSRVVGVLTTTTEGLIEFSDVPALTKAVGAACKMIEPDVNGLKPLTLRSEGRDGHFILESAAGRVEIPGATCNGPAWSRRFDAGILLPYFKSLGKLGRLILENGATSADPVRFSGAVGVHWICGMADPKPKVVKADPVVSISVRSAAMPSTETTETQAEPQPVPVKATRPKRVKQDKPADPWKVRATTRNGIRWVVCTFTGASWAEYDAFLDSRPEGAELRTGMRMPTWENPDTRRLSWASYQYRADSIAPETVQEPLPSLPEPTQAETPAPPIPSLDFPDDSPSGFSDTSNDDACSPIGYNADGRGTVNPSPVLNTTGLQEPRHVDRESYPAGRVSSSAGLPPLSGGDGRVTLEPIREQGTILDHRGSVEEDEMQAGPRRAGLRHPVQGMQGKETLPEVASNHPGDVRRAVSSGDGSLSRSRPGPQQQQPLESSMGHPCREHEGFNEARENAPGIGSTASKADGRRRQDNPIAQSSGDEHRGDQPTIWSQQVERKPDHPSGEVETRRIGDSGFPEDIHLGIKGQWVPITPQASVFKPTVPPDRLVYPMTPRDRLLAVLFDARWGMTGAGLRAWNGWSDATRDEVIAYLDSIGVGPCPYRGMDAHGRYDHFIYQCLNGHAITFPEPTGPKGGPDLSRPPYRVDHFPGGFQLIPIIEPEGPNDGTVPGLQADGDDNRHAGGISPGEGTGHGAAAGMGPRPDRDGGPRESIPVTLRDIGDGRTDGSDDGLGAELPADGIHYPDLTTEPEGPNDGMPSMRRTEGSDGALQPGGPTPHMGDDALPDVLREGRDHRGALATDRGGRETEGRPARPEPVAHPGSREARHHADDALADRERPRIDLTTLVILFVPRGEPFHQFNTASLPSNLRNTPEVPTPSHLSRREGPPPRPRVSPGLRASLTLEIDGRPYGVARVPDGWDLAKPSGESYRVSAEVAGWSCDCKDFEHRHRGLPTQGCRHIRSLRAVGLIPATEPALV